MKCRISSAEQNRKDSWNFPTGYEYAKNRTNRIILQDTGCDKGKMYAVNVPLRSGITDDVYQSVFVPVISFPYSFYHIPPDYDEGDGEIPTERSGSSMWCRFSIGR